MNTKLLNKSMKRSSSTKSYVKNTPVLQIDNITEKRQILSINSLSNPKKLAETSKSSHISLFTVSSKTLIKNKSMKPISFLTHKKAKNTHVKFSEPTLMISQIFGSSKDLRPPHKSPQPSMNPTAQSPIFDTLPLSFNKKTDSKLTLNIFQKLRRENTFRTRRLKSPF